MLSISPSPISVQMVRNLVNKSVKSVNQVLQELENRLKSTHEKELFYQKSRSQNREEIETEPEIVIY